MNGVDWAVQEQLKDQYASSGPGRHFWVCSASRTFYGDLMSLHGVAYADGAVVVYTTLQAAIDACVDYRGDTIHVERGSISVTTAILFNKIGIRIIADWGLAGLHNGEGFMVNADATYTTGPAGLITQPCYLEGLGFSALWNGHGALKSDDTLGGFEGGWWHAKNCRFPNWGDAVDPYGIEIVGGANMIVESCEFDGSLNAAYGAVSRLLAAGILIGDAGHNDGLQVLDCLFKNCTFAIAHGSNGADGFLYKGNKVIGTGKLVSFGADQTQIGLVADNWLGTASAGTGSYSVAIATMKGYGVQFTGNHYAE